MEKLLIKNGLIVTMNPDNEVIRDGSIYVEDNIIKEIGPDSKISNKTGAKEIDAHGKTIIPGMISCHNHLYSAVDHLCSSHHLKVVECLSIGAQSNGYPFSDQMQHIRPKTKYRV